MASPVSLDSPGRFWRGWSRSIPLALLLWAGLVSLIIWAWE